MASETTFAIQQNQQQVGELTVGTQYYTPPASRGLSVSAARRIGIGFICTRWTDTISSKLRGIIDNEIHGWAHKNFDALQSENQRGRLSECACIACDRTKNPTVRADYENLILQEVLDILRKQNHKPFHLKLCLFCSGNLLAEKTLLSRLLDALKSQSGTIRLFFIDSKYETAIQSAGYHRLPARDDAIKLLRAVGFNHAIRQFIQELTESAPSSIEISGMFFATGKDYATVAKEDATFRHDLLIGSGIELARVEIGKVAAAAGSGRKPIVLARIPASPIIARVEPNGDLTSRFQPGTNKASSKEAPCWQAVYTLALQRFQANPFRTPPESYM